MIPLFCGDEKPGSAGNLICTLGAYHVGGHLNQPTLESWPNRPTEPSLRSTLPDVEPTTIPRMPAAPRTNGVLPCYFCGKPAEDVINQDIGTCGRHDGPIR